MSDETELVTVKKVELDGIVRQCSQYKYAAETYFKERKKYEGRELNLTEYVTKQHSTLVKKVGEHEIDCLPEEMQQQLLRINKQYKRA